VVEGVCVCEGVAELVTDGVGEADRLGVLVVEAVGVTEGDGEGETVVEGVGVVLIVDELVGVGVRLGVGVAEGG